MALNRNFVALIIAAASCAACEPRFPDDLPALISAMGSNDMSTHQAAMRKVVQRYGGPGLRNALGNTSGSVRAKAAHGLAFCPGPQNERALIGAASDDYEYVRLWVAYSLGQIGTEHSVRILDQLQRDESASVRDTAATAGAVLAARLRGEPVEHSSKGFFDRLLARLLASGSPVCAPE